MDQKSSSAVVNNKIEKESECPVLREKPKEIGYNPDNNMPLVAEQDPWPDQKMLLPKQRVISTIPKGDFVPPHQQSTQEIVKDKWVYPSEQQFYNALKRKGWEPEERDMISVVAIHNAVNEETWRKVKQWENLHCDVCPTGPRLLKFQGKPKEPSPKAWLGTNFLGYTKPFDRHDWIVDRCGTQVRYVVDFYNGKATSAANTATTAKNDDEVKLETKNTISSFSSPSIYIDVRPALDSFEAGVDRLKVAIFGFENLLNDKNNSSSTIVKQ